jgi:hypothetical protein
LELEIYQDGNAYASHHANIDGGRNVKERGRVMPDKLKKSIFSKLLKYTKDSSAKTNCIRCKGKGYYNAVNIGEYEETLMPVKCACTNQSLEHTKRRVRWAFYVWSGKKKE